MKRTAHTIDVLQVMPDFGLAGAERMAENLSLELHRRGMRVMCVSMFSKHTVITDELESAGVKVTFLGKRQGLDFSMIPKLRRIVRTLAPAVVHTHRYCMQYSLPATVGLDVRRVHTVHNMAEKEVPVRIQRMQRAAFRNGSAIPVAINRTVRTSISKLYNLPEGDVPLVYNGIPHHEPSPVPTLPGDQSAFTFLTIGRAEPQKNPIALVKAFAEFHTSFPATKLIIIGDGTLRDDITAEIERLHAQSFIFQLGSQSNARDYCYAADMFVLPSLYEGMPMSLIEAMQAGLPVVASRRGGSVDMVADGVTGYLCNPDTCSIMKTLTRAFTDPRRAEIAQAGKTQSEKFTVTAMADGYTEVYGL